MDATSINQNPQFEEKNRFSFREDYTTDKGPIPPPKSNARHLIIDHLMALAVKNLFTIKNFEQ